MFSRDCSSTSLWQATQEVYTPRLYNGQREFDVIIIGGGITGISTALALQSEGKNCLVIESRNLCFGTTGGTTAHINTLLDTPYSTIAKNFGKQNARSIAIAATKVIEQVEHNIYTYSIKCAYTRSDAFVFAQKESEEKELESIFEASHEAGIDVSYQKDFPFPFSTTKLFKAAGQAKFNPIQYVYGLATAFEGLGGQIIDQCRVTTIDPQDPIIVTTTRGTFRAADIVYATHIPPGVNLIHLRCTPWRTYAMSLKLAGANYPEGLAYDMQDPYHYYRSQEVDGEMFLIAGGKDHITGAEEHTQHLWTQLEAEVRKYFDVKDVRQRWSSQYFESYRWLTVYRSFTRCSGTHLCGNRIRRQWYDL